MIENDRLSAVIFLCFSIEQMKRGEIGTEYHYGKQAEHGVNYCYEQDNGSRKGKEEQKNARYCVCNMYCNAVIGFENKSREIILIGGTLQFVLMKGGKAAKLGN